ncbi:MAG: GNAT family N-acetyltransferase [Dehalococcoidia bacterium]
MVDTALPSGRRAARATFAVERLTDAEAIRALLAPEGAYATFGVAHLAPGLFARCEWWSAIGPTGARLGGSPGRALVLHSGGGLGRAMLTAGDATALDAILRLHPGPRFSFASFRPEHLSVMERHFFLARKELMVRMSVARESLRPVEGEATRLQGRDIGRINRLYSAQGGQATYTSRHIDEGVYYGVIVEGRLVSIAGTHVDSPAERVAVVGNVFTHPSFRGGGLATIATSAVTRALLQHCDVVTLTVEAKNAPALAVYDKLGYRQVCTVYETTVVRKDALGLVSGLRRLAADWRGRREGKEIVVR